MFATPLLIDVCLTVHVNIIVFSISGCSFSIIGMQVAGQKLGLLAPTLDTQIVASD
jgi:hypothetical protein